MDFEHKVCEFMGKISADMDAMRKDVVDIKEGVSDYRKMKNRLIGAALVISTTTGAALQAAWKKFTDI